MSLGLAVGIASGVGSLVSDLFTTDEAKKNKRRAYDAYAKLLRSNTEVLTRADKAGDNFYTQAMDEMNKGVFAARGALNPGMLKTIAYSKMAAGRSGIEQQSRMTDEAYNDQIRTKMADIDATPVPSVNPINAFTAGVEGYLTGEQLSMTQELNKSYKGYIDKMADSIGTGTDSFLNDFKPSSDLMNWELPDLKPKLGKYKSIIPKSPTAFGSLWRM